jgi:DNA-binding GntR family transcriptional regulator
LAEQASRELERRLVTLQWAPGQLVQERDLVTALGIGRTPVREAVQRMAAMRLLQVRPRKGLLVAPLRPGELGQVIEARRVLERLLVVKAAERADPDQREALHTLAEALDSVQDDTGSLFGLDRQLDESLAQACGNPFLVEALAPLHAHCRRLWFVFREGQDVGQAAALHAHLARAVAMGDGAGAIRALNGIIGMLEGMHERLGTGA